MMLLTDAGMFPTCTNNARRVLNTKKNSVEVEYEVCASLHRLVVHLTRRDTTHKSCDTMNTSMAVLLLIEHMSTLMNNTRAKQIAYCR